MSFRIAFLIALCSASTFAQKSKPKTGEFYYPPAFEWKKISPEEGGFIPEKLKEAIDFSVSHETKNPRDMA
jgi:hypothetical protein